eukprot:1161992-Pelagomonas_calceolata.AAC.1
MTQPRLSALPLPHSPAPRSHASVAPPPDSCQPRSSFGLPAGTCNGMNHSSGVAVNIPICHPAHAGLGGRGEREMLPAQNTGRPRVKAVLTHSQPQKGQASAVCSIPSTL